MRRFKRNLQTFAENIRKFAANFQKICPKKPGTLNRYGGNFPSPSDHPARTPNAGRLVSGGSDGRTLKIWSLMPQGNDEEVSRLPSKGEVFICSSACSTAVVLANNFHECKLLRSLIGQFRIFWSYCITNLLLIHISA